MALSVPSNVVQLPSGQPRERPSETFTMMALAELHSQGRLLVPAGPDPQATSSAPSPTPEEWRKARSELRTQMLDAEDPVEGDHYAADKYNTVKGAEGIRKYEGDR